MPRTRKTMTTIKKAMSLQANTQNDTETKDTTENHGQYLAEHLEKTTINPFEQTIRIEFNQTNYLLESFFLMFKPRRANPSAPLEFYNYDDPLDLEIIGDIFSLRFSRYVNKKEYSYEIKKNIRKPCPGFKLSKLKGCKIHCSLNEIMNFLLKYVCYFADEQCNGMDYNEYVLLFMSQYESYIKKATEQYTQIEEELRKQMSEVNEVEEYEF